MAARKGKSKLSTVLFILALLIYVVNIIGILATVVLDSISKEWFSGFLPKIFTTQWYAYAAGIHDIPALLRVTFTVVVSVIAISLLIAIPAAYVMARYEFKAKGIIMTSFLLAMLLPPMAYGIPLAATLYKLSFLSGLMRVILANLVPTVPFIILILTSFIEQVGTNLESAARMLGAGRLKVFTRVIVPMIVPGILTSAILSAVRIMAMFDLTFLVAGPRSQTIIVALFSDVFAAGAVPYQAIDSLAVIYFACTMVMLGIALKFVSPTQMVFRLKD